MIGTKLGHYEISSHLGSGGMGDVYQASDSKLGRDVAVKILPEVFAHDETRRARFEREARVLASLNHPHIAAIYGLEQFAGQNFLVMELISGETLAERITHGSLPTREALTIARQIAEALEAAHEKGVVHRDLKPANIKLTADGQIKVLDFGLAKALTDDTAVNLSNSPTLSVAATNVGVILGTAAYMSPEQARGKEVDRRADIFAFGCVLYELVTGRKAFQGETVAEVLAAVLKSEPDWSRLPGDTPAAVRQLLRRCLQKDPKRRLQYSADLRIEIEEALAQPDVELRAVTGPRIRERVAWSVAVLLAIALGGALGRSYLRRSADAPEVRVDIVTPSTSDPVSFAISPDGRRLTFVASGDGQSRLWLRPLDTGKAQPLLGTEGASFPFWSPDSQSIGFFAEGKLKRVDIGGSPQTLADATFGRGGMWTPDGQIVFAPTGSSVLFRVPASGGTVTALTKFEKGQNSHRFPSMLPDGRRFVFYSSGTDDVNGTNIGSLDSPETKFLSKAALFSASYLAPGWLLSVLQGTLVAWPFDLARGEIRGDPVTVADPVGSDVVSRAALFLYRPPG
jgi:eukaryotic-like serine/threonine-protein kinase